MEAVFSGFTVIWLIIGVGFLIGKLNLLGRDARVVLSRVAFFVASPCLLFITISEASIREVLGPQFTVAALGAFSTLILFLVIGYFLMRGRSGAELMIGGLSASLVNSANLGFPIAAYVLGDISFAAPVVMFQLAFYSPLYIICMDWLTRGRGSTAQVRPSGKVSLLRTVGQMLVNPMIIGSVLGLLFSWQQWTLPGPVHDSVDLVAGAAIPLMLLSFGLSLVGSKLLEKEAGRRRDVLLASFLKLFIHPPIAAAFAIFLFGMEGPQLLIAVVMASLPSAQNVLVAAVRYESGETIARDTVLTTTILAIPGMIAVALLFG